MKIKMKTLQAGPNGVRQPGKVYDVPAAEADALISGGFAEKVKIVEKAEPVKPVDPEKTVEPSVEPAKLVVKPAKPGKATKPSKTRAATKASGRKAVKPEAEEPAVSPDEGEDE